MKKLWLLTTLILLPTLSHADNVILMIGDGMGKNHIQCAEQDKPLYLTSLPSKGSVRTSSANSQVTDSAASATAYSCGQKTNNHFLGKTPDQKDCLSIAEEAIQNGYAVGIYSTDHATGATPSAFYAHTTNRNDKKTIESDKKNALQTMDISVPVNLISDEVNPKLSHLSSQSNKKGFFTMFEGAKIDVYSHQNNLDKMKKELHDFDYAVTKAARFVYHHPDTTLIVLADHETGGLTDTCAYTTQSHTGQDISLYAYGKHAKLFEGEQENIQIYEKIKQILFQ